MKIIVTLISEEKEVVSEKTIKEEGYAHTLFEIAKVADKAIDSLYGDEVTEPTYYKGERDGEVL